jgi:hypothetical protein
MNRPLPLIAGLFRVPFLALAAAYWFIPAGDLPSVPGGGFVAGSTQIHFKRAIVSLIMALVLFAFAWLQGTRERL